jgi:hypothetical protein
MLRFTYIVWLKILMADGYVTKWCPEERNRKQFSRSDSSSKGMMIQDEEHDDDDNDADDDDDEERRRRRRRRRLGLQRVWSRAVKP